MAASQVGPTTPVELVESLYRRYPDRVDAGRRRGLSPRSHGPRASGGGRGSPAT